MIITTKPIQYALLKTQNPFSEMDCLFHRERNQTTMSTLFTRIIGLESNETEYINKLRQLDKSLMTSKTSYLKITSGLQRFQNKKLLDQMVILMTDYTTWESSGNDIELYHLNMGYQIKDNRLEWTKKKTFKDVMTIYDRHHPQTNTTIRKNFGVKVLYWMNCYLSELFEQQENTIKKVVYYGEIKQHEFYFLILLSKLGCDVLYINPLKDLDSSFKDINIYSDLHICKTLHNKIIPFPMAKVEKVQTTSHERVKPPKSNTNRSPQATVQTVPQILTEQSYESLAQFAESVVMIKVYNQQQEIIGGGSGVVISNKGFIVTNFHVVRQGQAFGVVYENDTQEYFTHRLVKYNQDYDLALLKVDKSSKPIALSKKDLVRGQKIMSIGSPLGLFNTISEGIVSGFRTFEDFDMIQISAPISPGSSGGALLDMYGNLAGITTSGFNGQNLNLAVPRKYIQFFAGNIINHE